MVVGLLWSFIVTEYDDEDPDVLETPEIEDESEAALTRPKERPQEEPLRRAL
ncbi:hypothetical protein FS819_028980 (plasmid) [Allorhizobium sp. Av2]